MDKIELKNALPEVFALRDDIRSEIWHREVTFERGHLYLVEAGRKTIFRLVSVFFENDQEEQC